MKKKNAPKRRSTFRYLSSFKMFSCVGGVASNLKTKNCPTNYLGCWSNFSLPHKRRETSKKRQSDVERNRHTKKRNSHHGGSVTFINDKRSRANAGRATGSFGVSTGATNSR